jgi:hypothetical protein
MDVIRYQKLLSNDGARAFLAKSYGLELLFILHECERKLDDNGIEDSYNLLIYLKPRRAAFSSHINVLEANGHIIKVVSEKKASKNVLRISADVRKAFHEFTLS